MNISRRNLLIASASALPGRFFGAPANGKESALWFQRMRRCVQHNFNEYDPKVLEISPWVDYWASLKADCIVLNAGGLMAFYPTRLPDHHKSQFLDGRDLFGDYLKAAKQRGMRVVARVETNWQHQDVLKAQPDWFERDEKGNPSPNVESPYIYHTCIFSDFHARQVPAIIREIASLYDVDGFFTNSWPETGSPHVCHCVNCRRRGEQTKAQLLDSHVKRSLELCRMLEAVCREGRKDRVYNVNIAGGIHAVQSIKSLAEVGQWLTADHQGRSGDTPIWDCAQQGRVAYSAMGGKPVTNVVTGNASSWRHTSRGDEEITLWLAQTTASGMVPWYVWLGSQPMDNRWRDTGSKYYQWLARHDAHFFNERPVANIGVVFSQRFNHLYRTPGATAGGYGSRLSSRPPAPGNSADYLQGVYYALLEGRFVFDFVHEDDLTPATLGKYQAVVLPNIALLSDSQAASLRAYTAGGGSLLATFETGMYNERGEPRKESVLGDLFGIARIPGGEGRVGAYHYANIERPHEILQGFQSTSWLPMGEYRVPVKASGAPILTVVPPYPRGIPEMVYAHERQEMPYPGPHSDEPAVVVRENGKSRLIYFSSDVDRCAWRSGNSDISRLLQNSLRWLVRGRTPVRVDGKGMVELFAWKTEPGYALHILNYNNPNMTHPWVRQYYPIGEQKGTMEVPAGVKVAHVELLRAERKIQHRQSGQSVEFTIPAIADFEVAALRVG
jgi:hypothetical protein